jgi:hypothetical protein
MFGLRGNFNMAFGMAFWLIVGAVMWLTTRNKMPKDLES